MLGIGPRGRRRVMLLLGLAGALALSLGYLRRIGCDPLLGDFDVGDPPAGAPRR